MDFKNEYIKNQIVENIAKGIEQGYFRKEINPEAMARLRVEQVQMAFDESIFPRDIFNLKELQLLIFDHFLHGIVTEKGKTLFQQHIVNQQSTQNN